MTSARPQRPLRPNIPERYIAERNRAGEITPFDAFDDFRASSVSPRRSYRFFFAGLGVVQERIAYSARLRRLTFPAPNASRKAGATLTRSAA